MARKARQQPRASVSGEDIGAFVDTVLAEGERLYRDLPWRRTSDPYEVLVSEVMLQQTQVSRVEPYYRRWLELFPTVARLASAPLADVLQVWQGLGYNRRAVALKRLAQELVERAKGGEAAIPQEENALLALPGVGPATASGIRAFAFGHHAPYLETNVRTVFLHEFFGEAEGVPDAAILPLLHDACDEARRRGVDARTWNYALLDYGAYLKKTVTNPSRRSAGHTRQSKFEGSNRQKRARLLRLVMESPDRKAAYYAAELAALEGPAKRSDAEVDVVARLLNDLITDGFLECSRGIYRLR